MKGKRDMKKNKIANLLMALIILCMVSAGVLIALYLLQDSGLELGTDYRLAASPKLELVSQNPENTCSVTIVCDTILENLDNLVKEKAPYVPKNAVILPETQVEFTEGETVFEVLNRACEAYELQIEYSWTPLYNSYYIEGINHLYEFDCGPQSGWMYKVNGWFPNYGCSEYKLKDGDTIVWCYTCNGLGADVGETWLGEPWTGE